MDLKKLALAAAAGTALLAAAPAFAHAPGWAPAYGWRAAPPRPHYVYRAPAYVYLPARPVYLRPPAPVYYARPAPVYYAPPAPVFYGKIPLSPGVQIGFRVRL